MRSNPPSKEMRRAGLTLIEILVVLFIISILLGLLFPAIQRARESTRNTVCQSNLHNLAIAMRDVQRKYWKPPPPDTAGGWSVGILLAIEEKSLWQEIEKSPSLKSGEISPVVYRRPTILACPSGYEGDSTISKVPAANYVLELNSRIDYFWAIGDAPISYRLPWVAGPLIATSDWFIKNGPHYGGYNIASTDGTVQLRIPE